MTKELKTHSVDDKEKLKIVSAELKEVNKLIQGHKKLLMAIGKLWLATYKISFNWLISFIQKSGLPSFFYSICHEATQGKISGKDF